MWRDASGSDLSGQPGQSDRGDRGDIVLGWLARVVVVLGLFALLGFDGVQMGLAKVSLADQATTAAQAARDRYADHHDVAAAFQAAKDSAAADNPKNVVVAKDFVIQANGSVTVELTRPIHTVVAHYLPVDAVKTATASGSADANP